MGEFKSGLYYLSKKRPDLELVPVHIDNMNRMLPRGEFLPVPLLSCITFGPPMWLETGEPKVEFLDAGPRGRAATEGSWNRAHGIDDIGHELSVHWWHAVVAWRRALLSAPPSWARSLKRQPHLGLNPAAVEHVQPPRAGLVDHLLAAGGRVLSARR